MKQFILIAIFAILIASAVNCPPLEENDIQWPETESGNSVIADCPAGNEGFITRDCDSEGVWKTPVVDCTQLRCEADKDSEDYVWPETDAYTDVNQDCKEGFLGTVHRFCNETGLWEEPSYSCTLACQSETIDGMTWPATKENEIAYNNCPADYIGDPLSRNCLVGGAWDSVVGTCQPLYCQAFTDENNLLWEKTEINQDYTLACQVNESGDISRHCSENGVWGDVQNTCIVVSCLETTDDKGRVWTTTPIETQASLSCPVDYVGSITRLCNTAGAWEDVNEECSLGFCSAENADEYDWPKTPVDMVATYECPEDYEGSISRVCGANGVWSSVENTCHLVFCPAEEFENMNWNKTAINTAATNECGKEQMGTIFRQCNSDGTWGLITRDCYPTVCQPEEYLGFSWPKTTINEEVSYPCGEDLFGEVNRLCQSDGTWAEVVSTCRPSVCQEDVYEGITWPKTAVDSDSVHNCAEDYMGEITRHCNVDGLWSAPVSTCRPSVCQPEVDALGLSWPKTPIDKSYNILCGEDFTGSYTRLCKTDGSWADVVSTCAPSVCQPVDEEGFLWPKTPIYESVSFDCGEDQSGTKSRTCQEDGSWTAIVSTCAPTVCQPNTESNGLEWPKTPIDTDSMKECGEDMDGSITRHCNTDATWNDSVSTCIPTVCQPEVIKEIQWPKTHVETTASNDCYLGYTGTITRECRQAGIWNEPDDSACVRNVCYDDNKDGYTWEATNSLETAHVNCPITFSGLVSRACNAIGVWEAPNYDECVKLTCAAEDLDEYSWPQTEANTVATLSCETGTGIVSRYCDNDGVWNDPIPSCDLGFCFEEIDSQGNVWPATPVHDTVSLSCALGYNGYLNRTCYIEKQTQYWGEVDNQCTIVVCPAVEEEGRSWPQSVAFEEISIDCDAGFVGNFTRYCLPSGEYSDITDNCEQLVCSSVEDEHGVWPDTLSGNDALKECPQYYHGNYKKFCNLDGLWEESRDECLIDRCPEEIYEGVYYESIPVLTEITTECRLGYTGSTVRTCNADKTWSEPVLSCVRNICPYVCEGILCFPETYESEVATLPCTDGSGGVYQRACNYDGTWQLVQDKCTVIPCNLDVEYTQLQDCMNVTYPQPADVAAITILPAPIGSSVPIVTDESSVLVCGLQPLTSYSLTVQLCSGTVDHYSCDNSNACSFKNVYNVKGCKKPSDPVLREVLHVNSQYAASVSFEMDVCSDGQAKGYQLITHCTDDNCSVADKVDTYVCGGSVVCTKGTIQNNIVNLPDITSLNYEITLRYYTVDNEENIYGPSSSAISVSSVATVAPAAPSSVTSQTLSISSILISWSSPEVSNNAAINNFRIRVLKFPTVAARRLEDEPVVDQVLDVCTDVLVCMTRSYVISNLESNTDYSIEILAFSSPSNSYSSPVTTISVHTITTPFITLSTEPADWYAVLRIVTNMNMQGTCSISKLNAASSQTLEVKNVDGIVSSYTLNNLSPNQNYNVYCLYSYADSVVSSSLSFTTLAYKSSALTTALSAIYSNIVSIAVSTTKPGNVYCMYVLPSMRTPSIYMLKQQEALSVDITKSTYYLTLPSSVLYNVFCYYEDLHGISMSNTIQSTLIQVQSNTNVYVPKIVSVSPVNNANDVSADAKFVYTFERSVVKGANTFSNYFILSDLSNYLDSSYIYMNNVEVEDNVVSVQLPVLSPSTTYSIQYASASVLTDKYTKDTLAAPSADTVYYFTTKDFSSITGTITVPTQDTPVGINTPFVIEFNQYVSFSDGYVDIALKDSTKTSRFTTDSPCLFLKQTPTLSTLTVDYTTCMGSLTMSSTYVLLFSYGVVKNQQGLKNEPAVVTFSTNAEPVAPVVLTIFPADGDEEVPTDIDIKISFNQPIKKSTGSLFFEEIEPTRQVIKRKFNVKASEGIVNNEFPYSLTIPSSAFVLNPSMQYKFYWSDSIITTINEPSVSNSLVDEAHAMSFWTAKFACSSKSMANNMANLCTCKSVNKSCVCSCGDVYAQYSP